MWVGVRHLWDTMGILYPDIMDWALRREVLKLDLVTVSEFGVRDFTLELDN